MADVARSLTLGLQQTSSVAKTQSQAYQKQEWTSIFPAPSTLVDLQAEPQLRYMLKGRKEIARYEYKDADGNTLGYVVRLEDKQGNKITPTLTFCAQRESEIKSKDHDQLLIPKFDSSTSQWRWQGFGNDRPLYGLDQLKAKSEAPVLIVEGEKTAESGKALFPDHAVVTWSGGCGSVHKSDWSVLKDRNVIIWPDNDQPGLKAAVKIAEILNAQGNDQVKTVDLPSTLPHKWDLADQLPEGLDEKELLLQQSSLKQSLILDDKNSKEFLEISEQQKDQERIESILNYLKTELTAEKHFWLDEKQIQYFKNIAERDPQEALKKWQYVTEDTSFKPLTKEEQHLKNLHDKQRDKDVEKFERLCEQHHKASIDTDLSQTRTIEQSLNELVAQHKNDPVFLKNLEDSNNKNVQKIAESFKDGPEIEQRDISRGFER